MRPVRDNRKSSRALLFYIITPVLFAIVVSAVLYFSLSPFFAPLSSALEILARDVSGRGEGVQINDLTVDPVKPPEETAAPVTGDDPPVDPPETGDTPTPVEDPVGPVLPNQPNAPTSYIPFGSFIFPGINDKYGWIRVENTAIDCALYMGDSRPLLNLGACTSPYSRIPGDLGTTLIGGHATAYFHTLGNAYIGDRVYITTNYGSYVYEITGTAISDFWDTSIFDLGADYENLVLYTCYPFSTLIAVNKRYYVYCRYISGPIIQRG